MILRIIHSYKAKKLFPAFTIINANILFSVIILFNIIVICFLSGQAFAGAWTQKAGALQSITTIAIYKAAEFFDRNGRKNSQNSYYKQSASEYIEYGLRDDLTIGGQLNLIRAYQQVGAQERSSFNLGDSEFFVRKLLWQSNSKVLSLQPYIIAPSLDKHNEVPKIGSDNFSFGLKINYGVSGTLYGYGYYLDLAGGLLNRGGKPQDQWKSEATLGVDLNHNWQIISQAFLTTNRRGIMNNSFTQSAMDDYDATTIQLSAKYRLTKASHLQAGAYKTISGRNIGAGEGVLFSYLKTF